jgi:hypothetical protein
MLDVEKTSNITAQCITPRCRVLTLARPGLDCFVKILRLYTTTAPFLKVLKCIGTAEVASQDIATVV